jgi:hypothetical protein
MDAYQLAKFIVYPVLQSLGEYSPDALRMVVGTAGVESTMGMYIAQTTFTQAIHETSRPGNTVFSGGIGPWQNEAATHDSLFKNYINYRHDLVNKMQDMFGPRMINGRDTFFAMRCLYDLNYAAAICRLRYADAPGEIPSTVEGMADYWKKYYNTKIEIQDQDRFVTAYNNLCAHGVDKFLAELQ